MDKHVPLTNKMKIKKITTPGSIRIHKTSKLNEGWLRKNGLNLNNNRTSWIIFISAQYTRSTYITQKHIFHPK